MEQEVDESPEAKGQGDEPSLTSIVRSLDGMLIVGLALVQLWMTIRWYPMVLQVDAFADLSGRMKIASSLVATAVLVAAALFSAKIWRFLSGCVWAVVACVCCVFGTVVIGAGDLWFGSDFLWALTGGLLTGIGSSMLLLSWMKACSQRVSVLNISQAFLLAVVLLFIMTQVNIAFGRSSVRDLVCGVAAVIASCVLLVMGRNDGSAVPPLCHTVKSIRGILGKYFWKVCLGSFLVGLSNELVRIMYYESSGSLASPDSSYAVVMLVLVVANGGIVWHVSSRQVSSFYFLCRMAVILCIAGTLLIPYMEDQGPLLFTLNTAGRQCLQLLLWIIVFTLSSRRRISSAVLFGSIFGAWDFGLFAGYALREAMRSFGAVSGVPLLGIVSIAATLLLAVAYVFLFSEKDSDRLFGFSEDSPARVRAFSRGCEYLSQKGSLTKRESEVFFLLAKGASVSHIEKKLYISSSTVATHMRHIYQKLGIHSRTELYDVVEETLTMLSADAAAGSSEPVSRKGKQRG